jgi:mRNA interferase MazF
MDFDLKKLRRGEVYWVKMDPAIGSEIKKTRPGVIVSNNAQNRASSRYIIVPLTTAVTKIYPHHVAVVLKGTKSKVLLDQIKTVDYQRIGTKLGTLTHEEMEKINMGLRLVLELG